MWKVFCRAGNLRTGKCRITHVDAGNKAHNLLSRARNGHSRTSVGALISES
jgi:hypothetical protein